MWLSRSPLRLEPTLLLLRGNHVDQCFVPIRLDGLEWRSHAAFVSEFDGLPANHLEEGVAAAVSGGFGMDDLAAPKINKAAVPFFHQLERATAPVETTHLQNIDYVKKVGRIGRRIFGSLDRAQQLVPFDRLRKNLGLGNFEMPLSCRIVW